MLEVEADVEADESHAAPPGAPLADTLAEIAEMDQKMSHQEKKAASPLVHHSAATTLTAKKGQAPTDAPVAVAEAPTAAKVGAPAAPAPAAVDPEMDTPSVEAPAANITAANSTANGSTNSTTTTVTLHKLYSSIHGTHLAHQNTANDSVSLPVAATAILFLLFGLYVLYMVNAEDAQIRISSYKVISKALAIFMAVMLEKSQVMLLTGGLKMHYEGDLEATAKSLHMVLMPVAIYWYWMMTLSCKYFKDNEEHLVMCKEIVMHIAAFMSIEVFSGEQQKFVTASLTANDGTELLPSYEKIFIYYLMYVLVTVALLKLLTNITELYRHNQLYYQSHIEPVEGESTRWLEVAQDCENSFSGLVFGFLVSKAILFLVTDKIQTAACDHYLCEYSLEDQSRLWMAGGAVVVLFALSVQFCNSASPEGKKFAEFVELHVMYLTSWILLAVCSGYVNYTFHEPLAPLYEKSQTVERTATAFLSAPLMALAIVGIDKLGDVGVLTDRSANEVLLSIALLTGLVWQRAFSRAVETVATSTTKGLPALYTYILSTMLDFAVVASLAPAWKWYILPYAMQEMPKREVWDTKDAGAGDSAAAAAAAEPAAAQ